MENSPYMPPVFFLTLINEKANAEIIRSEIRSIHGNTEHLARNLPSQMYLVPILRFYLRPAGESILSQRTCMQAVYLSQMESLT